MYGFFIVLHIIICVGMMISVLMQSAKGEGLAGAFGGSSLTGTVFGGRGAAPFLAKATSGLAVAFFLSCILLTFMSPARMTTASGPAESAVEKAARERAGEIPVQQQQTLPAGEIPSSEQPGGQATDQPAEGQPGTEQTPPPPSGNQEPEPGSGG